MERDEEDPAELESLESEDYGEEADRYCISACMRKDDSGLEDQLEYFWDAPIPSDSDEQEEDRWWSLGPWEPSPEEDEEEVQYLVDLLGSGPKEGKEKGEEAPPQFETEMSPIEMGCRAAMKEPEGGGGASPRPVRRDEPSTTKEPKRRKLRRKRAMSKAENGRPRGVMPGYGSYSLTAQRRSPRISTQGSRNPGGG